MVDKKQEPFGWKIEKVIKKGDYLYCIVRNHPKANKHGYVLHHRVIVENHLGRLLNSDEEVHHINGNKHDNRVENLQVMKKGQHQRYHALKQGAKYVDLKCPNCGKLFSKRRGSTFLAKKGLYTCCSLKCRGQFSRMIQLHGKTPKVESAISENLVREYICFPDNPEETEITGSVETIRTQPEMVKI